MEKENSRRDFIKKSAVIALGTIAASAFAGKTMAAAPPESEFEFLEENGKFTLPLLPYAYDALEPHIDKMTMEIHHSKHHQAYITNLNKAIDADKNFSSLAIEQILAKVNSNSPAAVRNNAGGHYNHSLFWTMMKPNGGGEPSGKLAEAIKAAFTSIDEFKKQFADASLKRFGSGWAWLVLREGKLMITSTANQDNPLMNLDSVEVKGTPLLALDVWEHAYYLKNQNRRADYITSFWNVINWDECEKLFNHTK